MKLYGLKNCDTCKKASKALQAAGQTVEFIDIRAEADLPKKVPDWVDAVGLETLVNKRSTTWRTLSESEKNTLEQGGGIKLLIDNPTLIKRPVLETAKTVRVGWSKSIQQDINN